MTETRSLTDRVRAGHVPSIARMISRVERGADGVEDQMAELYATVNDTHVIGLTGAPGSGKSTVVYRLARTFRRRHQTVGIVAVDPSSPFSGGSILGDRIRMNELGQDRDVFIRSMATRGALGGLARTTVDAVTVLAAAGKSIVLIETVGAGQDEVDIVRAAHSTVVVSVPGMGDDVQAAKAGLLEIADVHLVNKADHDGADRLVAQLKDMLRLAERDSEWVVPVHMTTAVTGDGVDDLADLLEDHLSWLRKSGELQRRERHMAASRIRSILLNLVLDQLDDPSASTDFDGLVTAVCERDRDPFSAARLLLDTKL
ncbi:MAG: methylmalonyl Co-A mutase-associated GTPase MeaB [Egibacteraceae bacterium]